MASILNFLELSRKLKQDGPDAELVEVATKAVQSIDENTRHCPRFFARAY